MNRLQSRPASISPCAGFTLLEMMVALGILAVAYVALLEAQSASIRLSSFGKQITVATFLAQTKMEEIEEKLTREGFPDMDDTDDGHFKDLGYQNFYWKLAVNKIELPLGAAMNQLLSQFGSEGKEGEAGATGAGGLSGMLQSSFGNKLPSNLSSMTGAGAGGISSMMNPEMLKGQVDMLADTLEQSLREVKLTVYWEEGGPGKELVLTTHLVQVPQAGGAQPVRPGIPGGIGKPGLPGGIPP